MRTVRTLVLAAFTALTLVLLVSATPARAQAPRYLHALSDLRTARAFLLMDGRPAFRGDRDLAVQELERAIKEMQEVVIDDGRNPWHTPPPQSEGNPISPIRQAIRMMNEAVGDVEQGRDDPRTAGLQARSIQHIKRTQAILAPWM
ncbi:MAG: hypothetical protein ABR907_13840 [Terracidiphilus sp.]